MGAKTFTIKAAAGKKYKQIVEYWQNEGIDFKRPLTCPVSSAKANNASSTSWRLFLKSGQSGCCQLYIMSLLVKLFGSQGMTSHKGAENARTSCAYILIVSAGFRKLKEHPGVFGTFFNSVLTVSNDLLQLLKLPQFLHQKIRHFAAALHHRICSIATH